MKSKCLNWVRIVGMLLIIGLGASASVSDRVYAASVEEESLKEQLSQAFEKGCVYAINQDGSGDFMTIQEGVNAAESGDTLLIYPGIYEENVEIIDKTVDLLGIDKETCILQYDSKQYEKVPLTFSAGYVANLTIYGFSNENIKEVNNVPTVLRDNSFQDSIREWHENFSGYAIHIDDNYAFGKEIYIENCRIVSNNNQCIGIGCRGNSKITIDDCELTSDGTGGCIYFHNTDNEELGGDTYFTVKNCELKNYISPYVVSMHCMGAGNPVYLTFQNVRISTVAYEDKSGYDVTNMYTGLEIDEPMQLDGGNIQLEEYYSNTSQGLVTYYNNEEAYEYITSLQERVAPFKQNVIIPEGILYLNAESMEDSNAQNIEIKKRFVIDIYNNSQLVGDGWCGLEYMYLTPESFGNTLIEMNYPILQ